MLIFIEGEGLVGVRPGQVIETENPLEFPYLKEIKPEPVRKPRRKKTDG